MTVDQQGKASKEATARAKIERFYRGLDRQNHFQLFGAGPDTDAEKLKAAYHNLVKQYHADAYSGMDLGETKEMLDVIFSRVQHAYETLTEPKARQEYMVLLERQSKGLSTDVNAILGAEQHFDEALAKLKRKDYVGARTQLEQAMKLNPDDPLMPVHHAWASYHAERKNTQVVAAAIESLKKSAKADDDLALAWQYLGQIYFSLDRADEAKRAWKKCIEAEPKNIDASRGLRLLGTRDAQNASGLGALVRRIFKRSG